MYNRFGNVKLQDQNNEADLHREVEPQSPHTL